MGRVLQTLAEGNVVDKTIFNNRFVVELCELIHVHYRNLRILMSLGDFVEMAQGMSDALKRWNMRGNPEPSPSSHIELCRKVVASSKVVDDVIKVNLNKNLYPENEGKIFSEGANFDESEYIHLKIRDLRIELSRSEFDTLINAILEAKEALCPK